MSDQERSGPHQAAPTIIEDRRGFVVEVKHIVAAAAFLGFGGVGAGAITLVRVPQAQSPEVATALAQINAKLDLLIHDESELKTKVDDHEKRVQAIELRLAAMGVKP